MRSRCRNDPGYKHVTVCDRWQVYQNFVEDMGVCPNGLSLDRISNLLGYCKSNCRWASMSIQQHNKRKRTGTASFYRGVTQWRSGKRSGKWQASIRDNYKLKYLGTFDTEIDAAMAFDTAARLLHGPAAATNFPSAPAEEKLAA
jgi:hypothetical protein